MCDISPSPKRERGIGRSLALAVLIGWSLSLTGGWHGLAKPSRVWLQGFHGLAALRSAGPCHPTRQVSRDEALGTLSEAAAVPVGMKAGRRGPLKPLGAVVAGHLPPLYYLYMVMAHGGGQLTDSAVVSAASGCEVAAARLAEVLLPRVRLMVAARLSPKPSQFEAVDDVTQLIMLGVIRGLGGLKNRTVVGLKGWLSSIVSHKVADYIKDRGGPAKGADAGQRSLESTVDGYPSLVPLWKFLSAADTTPSSAAARTEQIETLMNHLGQLKAEHHKVLILAFFDQVPSGQIARQLGISRPAASMLLIRAIKALRRRMTGSSRIEDQP